MTAKAEREREGSVFFRGYRYALRDQDTTWLAACGTVHRGHNRKDYLRKFQVWSLEYAAQFVCTTVFSLVVCVWSFVSHFGWGVSVCGLSTLRGCTGLLFLERFAPLNEFG